MKDCVRQSFISDFIKIYNAAIDICGSISDRVDHNSSKKPLHIKVLLDLSGRSTDFSRCMRICLFTRLNISYGDIAERAGYRINPVLPIMQWSRYICPSSDLDI